LINCVLFGQAEVRGEQAIRLRLSLSDDEKLPGAPTGVRIRTNEAGRQILGRWKRSDGELSPAHERHDENLPLENSVLTTGLSPKTGNGIRFKRSATLADRVAQR